jgi:hypothetical protein
MSHLFSPTEAFEKLLAFKVKIENEKYSDEKIKNTFYKLLIGFDLQNLKDLDQVTELVKGWFEKYRPAVTKMIAYEMILENRAANA